MSNISLNKDEKNLETECCGECVEICGMGQVRHAGEDSWDVRF